MSIIETASIPELQSLSAYGPARCSVPGNPLDPEELRKTDAWWRACNYLTAVQDRTEQ
jgi:xylulose-5-phosphate/fructose-6-phosphate phosphoketolase